MCSLSNSCDHWFLISVPTEMIRRILSIFGTIIFAGICIATIPVAVLVLAPTVIDWHDRKNTRDVTHLLLSQKKIMASAFADGKLFCLFGPKDPASAAVQLSLGVSISNRWRDVEDAATWVVGGIDIERGVLTVYTVDANRLDFGVEGNRPCGRSLVIKIIEISGRPTAVPENVDIEVLGRDGRLPKSKRIEFGAIAMTDWRLRVISEIRSPIDVVAGLTLLALKPQNDLAAEALASANGIPPGQGGNP